MAILGETKQGQSRRIEPSCHAHNDEASHRKTACQSSQLAFERDSSSGSMISDGSESQMSLTSLIERSLSKLHIGVTHCSDSPHHTRRDDDVSTESKYSRKQIMMMSSHHDSKVRVIGEVKKPTRTSPRPCRHQSIEQSPCAGTFSDTRSNHNSNSHLTALARARKVTKHDGETFLLDSLASQKGGEPSARLESFPPISWDDVADRSFASCSTSTQDDVLATMDVKEDVFFPQSMVQESCAAASWSKRKCESLCSAPPTPSRSMKRCKSFGSRLCALGSLGPASFSSRAA